MSLPKRATVYFDPEIHRALLLKAVATERSISEMVNDAVEDKDRLVYVVKVGHWKDVYP